MHARSALLEGAARESDGRSLSVRTKIPPSSSQGGEDDELNEMKKSGGLTGMKAAGYSDEDCCEVCRALFMDQTEDDMRPAWDIFSKGGAKIDAFTFKRVLPLMGDEVSDDAIEDLFELADTDGSGDIDFKEFMVLVKGMNPKPAEEEGGGMFSFSPF